MFLSMVQSKLLCFLLLLKLVNSINVLRRKIEKKPEIMAIITFKTIKHLSPGMLPENGFQKLLSNTGINLTGFTWGLDTEQMIT